MAKTYAIENTTLSPVRPILLSFGKTGKALKPAKVLSPDGIPVVLSEKDYEQVKDALTRYEKAGMVRIKVSEEAMNKAKKESPSTKQGEDFDTSKFELQALREVAGELGIKGWQLMKREALEEAVAKATKEKEAAQE